MHSLRPFLQRNSKLITAIAVGVIFLGASPAWAAQGDVFGDLGDKLWSLGLSTIRNLGRGAVLLGGGWAILAFIGRMGHLSFAISVFIAGIFLANLPTLVTYLFPS